METFSIITAILAGLMAGGGYLWGKHDGRKQNRSQRIKDYEAGRNDGYRCFSRSGEQYLKTVSGTMEYRSHRTCMLAGIGGGNGYFGEGFCTDMSPDGPESGLILDDPKFWREI